MAKGRHKTSESLNNLHGNPGRRKGVRKNFTPEQGQFGLPKGLNVDVRKKCRQMAQYLEDQGAPVRFMRPVFERYCKHLQVCYLASEELRNGVMKGNNKHPAAQIWKDNSQSALQIEQYFEKILKNTKPPERKDPLDDFLAKGGKPYAVKRKE